MDTVFVKLYEILLKFEIKLKILKHYKYIYNLYLLFF